MDDPPSLSRLKKKTRLNYFTYFFSKKISINISDNVTVVSTVINVNKYNISSIIEQVP